jgi:broad specificity phosphatase PhoE
MATAIAEELIFPFDDKDIAQAESVDRRLRDEKLDAAYSSPLKRVCDTAKITFGNNR